MGETLFYWFPLYLVFQMWLVRNDHLWLCTCIISLHLWVMWLNCSTSLLYEWSTLYCLQLQVYFWFWFYLLFLTKKLSMVFCACWQYILAGWYFYINFFTPSFPPFQKCHISWWREYIESKRADMWHFISDCKGGIGSTKVKSENNNH